jgi:hypothetical protein
MYTLYISYTSNFTNLGVHLLIKMMNETRLNDNWNSQSDTGGESRHGLWRDSVRESRQAVWHDSIFYVKY